MGRCKQAAHCGNPSWCKTTGKCLKAEPRPCEVPGLCAEMNRRCDVCDPLPAGKPPSVDAIAAAVAAAIAAERERCAKIADQHQHWSENCCDVVAMRIREG